MVLDHNTAIHEMRNCNVLLKIIRDIAWEENYLEISHREEDETIGFKCNGTGELPARIVVYYLGVALVSENVKL